MSVARRIGPIATIVLTGSVLLATTSAYASQGPVGLGQAKSFAVLAGSGITNTGPTTITGDMGTFPTPSETGFASITLHGTNHAGDAVTQGAKNDLVTAYNDAAGRSPVTNVPVELGGSTLLAGVYTSPTLGLTGTLTLDGEGKADAEFVFKAGSTLITATNSRVRLINGADPCHVVWQVGSSATFNTGTRFVGDVLAHTSISALTGATFQGRLLARVGAVTLDTNTITNANCAAPTSGGGTPTPAGDTTPGIVGSTPAAPGDTNQPAPTIGSGGTPTAASLTPALAPATPGAPTETTGTPTATPTATPGTPTATPGTPTATPGTPTATPGTPTATPGTPTGRPALPRTGQNVVDLIAAGFALIVFGAIALETARRRRTAQVWVG